MKYMRRTAGYTWTDYKTDAQIAKELKITQILDKLLEYKRSWMLHVNRMPRNRLRRVMKHYSPTGRRNHGRPLKRLLDTWERNGSTSGPTPWKTSDDDDDDDKRCPILWTLFPGCLWVVVKELSRIPWRFVMTFATYGISTIHVWYSRKNLLASYSKVYNFSLECWEKRVWKLFTVCGLLRILDSLHRLQ